MDDDFLKEIKNLAAFLFDPKRLVVKKTNGRQATCSELAAIIVSSWKTLKNQTSITVKGIAEVSIFKIEEMITNIFIV